MPNKPTPQEVTVDSKTTALLVLDLNCRCEDPKEPCYQLINPVAKFLGRARQANMFILYTAADRYKDTAEAFFPRRSTNSTVASYNRRCKSTESRQ
ncbi:MAG: hypothetical protein E6J73_15905 [Deltaproteobacteria bacterium]|nr:MAG: hypothetical protein E6J73_15905 [Deltaproteobacteria bacterium]